MDTRSIRQFLALADALHFGRAAERCFVSQPTLSAQIKKLEEQLGVQLVERSQRKVMVTELGYDIAVAARGIGLAAHFTFGGYAAHAIEVTVTDGKLAIERIVAAIDCGYAVHPNAVEAQLQGDDVGLVLGDQLQGRVALGLLPVHVQQVVAQFL